MADRLGDVVKVLLTNALAGDVKAARLLLERVVPPMRAEAAPIKVAELDPTGTLVSQGQAILAAVAAGQVPPDVAASLLSGLGSMARLREIEELEKRIAALEQGEGQ